MEHDTEIDVYLQKAILFQPLSFTVSHGNEYTVVVATQQVNGILQF